MLDTFIQLCESKVYGNSSQILRIRDMETRDTGLTSTTDRFMDLPDGYLEMRRIDILVSGDALKLEYKTPVAMHITSHVGQPKYFTVTSQIEFDCVSQSAYTVDMLYYSRLPALTEAAPSNAILTRFPMIYLHGSLAALYQWAKQPDQADYYYGQFLSGILEANTQDQRGRYGPSPVISVVGPTP
jgi:hypothetical protein